MALNQTQQIKKILEDKKHVLITFDKNSKGDAIGSALAWYHFLKKLGKRVDIVSSDFILPQGYRFLKHSKKIYDNIGHLRRFIMSLNISKTGIKELSYDVQDEKLKIFLTPKHGMIKKQDIHTSESGFSYDLILVLDTADLASLGSLYTNNSDFFTSTPIINIDHKPNNEHFGHINVVDITAGTTAEIVFQILKAYKAEDIDKYMATALLAAMIGSTNSFKSASVRHHTLSVASELVQLGADRNYIIENLYHSKSIETFKLWGAALSNLQQHKDINLVWTTITREYFARSGAHKQDLTAIIDELISHTPAAKIIVIIHEHPDAVRAGEIHGIVQTEQPHDALALTKAFGGTGSAHEASFVIHENKTLKEVEEMVVEHIKGMIEEKG